MDKLLTYSVPLGVTLWFGVSSEVWGVWDDNLNSCQMLGTRYNPSGKYIELTEDVWRDKELLNEWENSTEARTDYRTTMNGGMLWKNGVLMDDDSWRWKNEQKVELLTDIYRKEDKWEISYEKRVEVATPVIYVGQLPIEKTVVVDGYIYQKYDRYLKEFDIEENLSVGGDYKATLKVGWCVTKEGELRTRKGRVLTGWSFEDEKTVVIEPWEYKIGEEYVLKYKGVWDWIDVKGVEVSVRGSDDGDVWTQWQEVNFGDKIDTYKYYIIKVRLGKEIKAGDIRIRSLVIKAL